MSVRRIMRHFSILSMECIAIRCILLSYMLHHTELLCTWASLHPFLRYLALSELHCTPSCAAFYWATLHPTKLHCTLLSYASPWRATPPKHRTLLSFAAPCWAIAPAPWPYWALVHPSELRWIFWAMLQLSEPPCTLQSYAVPYWATLYTTELHSGLWVTLHPKWATSRYLCAIFLNAGMQDCLVPE